MEEIKERPQLSTQAPGPEQNVNLAQRSKRIIAIDVCKGIAVLGMMFMNFKIAVLQSEPLFFSYSFLTSMEGRFGVLFIFMAGVGISLMTARARREKDSKLMTESVLRLVARSVFLFLLGMVFSLYWQADILHFYAIYLLIAAPFLFAPKKALIAAAVITFLVAIGLHFFIEWETGWNWATLEYDGFYTFEGFIRNVMFNGFHPVFPWMSFLFIGMYVGRLNLRNPVRLKRMAIIGAGIFAVCEISGAVILSTIEPSLLSLVLNTSGFPTTPLYVISSTAMSIALISSVVLLERRFTTPHPIIKMLQNTGATVMTQYTTHLLIGLPLLIGINWYWNIGLLGVTIFSVVYYVLSLFAIHAWKNRFTFGPLEGLMRRMSG